MYKKRSLAVLLAGVIGVSVYQYRRQLIGKALHLQAVRYGVTVQHRIPISMPDGVKLYADLYRPRSPQLFPTIVVRTPYGRSLTVSPSGSLMSFAAQRFAERGYNLLVQDVRGRFESEGVFIPFVAEASDGRATLEWVERQSWFNGLLGMWGASYLGYAQWAAARGASPALKALVPAATGSNMPVSFLSRGAFDLDAALRWMYTLDAMNQPSWLRRLASMRRMSPRVLEPRLKAAINHMPLVEIDRLMTGKSVLFYQEWLKHPSLEDPFWQAADHSSQAGSITAAAHFISGWYDVFLRDLLADYAAMRRTGQQPYLTIGPWNHLHPDLAREDLRQGLIWFDAFLKGDRRELRQSPVRLFILGAGEWRDYPDWPPPSQPLPFYLVPDGGLSRAPHPDNSTPNTEPSRYIYDPNDPTPAYGGALLGSSAGPVDNRPLEARPDVLTFTSPVVESGLEMIGPVRAVLYVRSDRAFTDFFIRLCVVEPDGVSTNVSDGFQRLSPGSGELQADGTLRLEIELSPTTYYFGGGRRLRVQVSSGAHPRYVRNPGNGYPVTETTELLPARQEIFHDARHPSVIILPRTR